MRTFLCFILVLAGVLISSSCEKVAFEPPVIEGQVSFLTDVTPPLNSTCGGCHQALKSQANFYKSLATHGYIDTVNATSSNIYKKLSTDATHKAKLSPDDLAKILLWFEQGAKNN